MKTKVITGYRLVNKTTNETVEVLGAHKAYRVLMKMHKEEIKTKQSFSFTLYEAKVKIKESDAVALALEETIALSELEVLEETKVFTNVDFYTVRNYIKEFMFK